jgi:hypothetical protein
VANFQFLGEDERSFQVQDPTGRTMTIAKATLDPESQEKIRSLAPQNLAQKEPLVEEPISPVQAVPQISPEPTQEILEEPVVHSQATPNQVPPTVIPEDALTAYAGGEKNREAGLQKMIDQESRAIGERQKLASNYEKDLQSAAVTFGKNIENLENQNRDIQEWLRENPQDSGRVWSNVSVANRATAAIGILLSGIGAALLGQKGNAAMEVLDKLVDQDIKDQQAARGEKQNLYQTNLLLYRNAANARDATAFQLKSVLQAQMEKLAGQSGSVDRQLLAQNYIQQMKIGQAELAKNIGERLVDEQLYGVGGREGGLAASQIPYSKLSDKDFNEKSVKLGDKVYEAHNAEDAKIIKKMEAAYAPIEKQLEELTTLKDKYHIFGINSALNPFSTDNQKSKQLQTSLATLINEFKNMGALTKEHKAIFSSLVSDPTAVTEFFSGSGKNKTLLEDLKQELEANKQQRLRGYLGKSDIKSLKKRTR